MPEIEPLTAEEIDFVRRVRRRWMWIIRGTYVALGTAIGGAALAWFLDI